MVEEKNKQLIKVIVILVSILFLILVTIALIQTFTIKGLENKLSNIENNNQATLEQIEKTENEITIRETEDYIDEYLEKEGYGKDGEVILK